MAVAVTRYLRVKNGAWFGIESKESARWNTSPSKNLSLYALAGVEGTVACAAGPRAALRGVAGRAMEGDKLVLS